VFGLTTAAAAAGNTCVSRSIDTTKTSCSDALDAASADEVHDREGAARPSSPASRQPAACSRTSARWRPSWVRELHPDRECDSARRDCHRVDVPAAGLAQRLPQPPALELQRAERALYGILGPSFRRGFGAPARARAVRAAPARRRRAADHRRGCIPERESRIARWLDNHP
jgi:hypothetical protein